MESKILRRLPGTLYSAVVMELLERLAYYGMLLVLGMYLMGELGVPPETYGPVVAGFFTSVLYLLPLVAGALADKCGYKPALMVAFPTPTSGYSLLGNTTRFPLICVALGLIAVGGTIAPRDQIAVYLGYSFFAIFIGNFYSGPWAGWVYGRFIRGPIEAGLDPTPWLFFAGVMVMGALSTVGLAVYGRFVVPPAETAGG